MDDPCGYKEKPNSAVFLREQQRLILFFSYDKFIYKKGGQHNNWKWNYFSYIRNSVLKKGICTIQIKNAVHNEIMRI